MQTAVGYTTNAAGQFIPAGRWLDIIFNPSFPYRLAHTVGRKPTRAARRSCSSGPA